MKTDKLREIWKMFPSGKEGIGEYTEEELLAMLKSRAELSIKRLNRSIYFETISTFIALVVIVIYFYHLNSFVFIKWGGTFIIALIVLYFGLIGWLYQQLNSIALVSVDMKLALKKKVGILKRFVNLYFWMNMVVAPVVFPIAVFSGYFTGRNETDLFHDKFNLSEPHFLIPFVISFVLIFLFYPFLKWYIKRLYGRHVKDLEECLAGLSEGYTEEKS